METQVDIDVKLQGRKDDDNVTSKDVNAAELTVFDDEEKVGQAAARKKQEKDDLERAKVLQQQYEDNEENINWNEEDNVEVPAAPTLPSPTNALSLPP
nr:hypothetical protein [Tanacetum cinerariifolium]